MFSIFFLGFLNTSYAEVDVIGKILTEENINTPENRKSINEYLKIIKRFESNNDNDGKNYCTLNGSIHEYGNCECDIKPPKGCTNVNTAKGYYQFIDKTFFNIKKKLLSEYKIEDKNCICRYSESGQSNFAFYLWYSQGGDQFLANLTQRDPVGGFQIYCQYHHTACGAQLDNKRRDQLLRYLNMWSAKGPNPFEATAGMVSQYMNGGNNVTVKGLNLKEICEGRKEGETGLIKYDGVCDEKTGFQGLFDTIQALLSWLIRIAMIIGVFSLLVVGFRFLTANGNQNQMSEARRMLVNVVLGLFLSMSAFFIINFVFDILLIDDDYNYLKQVDS